MAKRGSSKYRLLQTVLEKIRGGTEAPDHQIGGFISFWGRFPPDLRAAYTVPEA